jgi:hypothetical protein
MESKLRILLRCNYSLHHWATREETHIESDGSHDRAAFLQSHKFNLGIESPTILGQQLLHIGWLQALPRWIFWM